MKHARHILSLFYVLIFSGLHLFSQPPAPAGYSWQAVAELSDEFNDTVLDSGKWIDYHPYWKGREPSQFSPDNIFFRDGSLCLQSTVVNEEMEGNWIASACVSSKTKAMQPGYYSEARIKCPEMSMTGAYWFQGDYSEIDVIENFGDPTGAGFEDHETYTMTNLHYFKGGWSNDITTPWKASILFPSCAARFFTYGVWWKDHETVIFYLDGKEIHTSKTGGPFDEPMYMFFDMEAFQWGIGMPTMESLQDNNKNTQYIDFVRTFKLVEERE